jgi:hypothetical protein
MTYIQGMTKTQNIDTEAVIARLRSEPDHEWHIARNTDGGAAAEDFIRNAKARNARSQAEKDASHREAVMRCLAQMQA